VSQLLGLISKRATETALQLDRKNVLRLASARTE